MFDIDHDGLGLRTAIVYPNQTRTTYTYDARNRLAVLATRHTVLNALVQSYAFANDHVGNRTRIDEADGAVKQYGYDELYRLTSESGSDGSGLNYAKTFGYDAVGNRTMQMTTGEGAGSVVYTYDERDRLLSEGLTAYACDASGNLVSKSGEATYVGTSRIASSG